ncbi:MAG: plasmid stabilization protein [Chthoniobacterales bacterium]
MAQGSKAKYTDKQKRKAEHIEEGYEKRGVSKKEAESRAWATVNKEDKGGKKSGLGRRKKSSKASSRKSSRKGAKTSTKKN